MNGKQNLVRGVGISVLVLLALFPPWQLSYTAGPTGESKSSSVGYLPLWNPPASEVEVEENASNVRYRVDFVRLGLQLAAVLILINVGVYLLKSPPNHRQDTVAGPP